MLRLVLSQNGSLTNGTAVTAALWNTTFEGLQGEYVRLDAHGDRVTSYEIMNYVAGAAGNVSSVPVRVGLYNSTSERYTPKKEIAWPGGTNEVY